MLYKIKLEYVWLSTIQATVWTKITCVHFREHATHPGNECVEK